MQTIRDFLSRLFGHKAQDPQIRRVELKLPKKKTAPALQVGMMAVITSRWGMYIHTAPSIAADAVDWMPQGARVKILDGPKFAEDEFWWFVNYQGLFGWVAEGDRNTAVYMKPA